MRVTCTRPTIAHDEKGKKIALIKGESYTVRQDDGKLLCRLSKAVPEKDAPIQKPGK